MVLTPVGYSWNISLILHCWYVAKLGAVDLLPTTDEFPVNCLLIFSPSKSVHPTQWAADPLQFGNFRKSLLEDLKKKKGSRIRNPCSFLTFTQLSNHRVKWPWMSLTQPPPLSNNICFGGGSLKETKKKPYWLVNLHYGHDALPHPQDHSHIEMVCCAKMFGNVRSEWFLWKGCAVP